MLRIRPDPHVRPPRMSRLQGRHCLWVAVLTATVRTSFAKPRPRPELTTDSSGAVAERRRCDLPADEPERGRGHVDDQEHAEPEEYSRAWQRTCSDAMFSGVESGTLER